METRFYWNWCCIKIFRQAKTFNANKGCKLAIFAFIPISPFSKCKFLVFFSNVICKKTRPFTPYFLYANEWLQNFLSLIMKQMTTFLGIEVRFLSQFQSLSLGPIFRVWRISRNKFGISGYRVTIRNALSICI